MKFKLISAEQDFSEKDIPLLEKYGFKYHTESNKKTSWIKVNNSLWGRERNEDSSIEITSLDDIKKIEDDWNHRVIVSFKDMYIIIYNSYME